MRILSTAEYSRSTAGLVQSSVQTSLPQSLTVAAGNSVSASSQQPLPVELAELSSMKSSQLRKLSQAAASEGAHSLLWDAIAKRCDDFAEQMRHWDIIYVLQAFTDARVDNNDLFLRFADALCAKTSKLPPKLLSDVFAVYEAVGLRPRALYVELFHAMIRLSRSMYAEELSQMLQCLARHRLGNPTVVAHLVDATMRQLRDMRFRYLCSVVGALGSLQMVPDTMLTELDRHAKFELETIAAQELLENLQAFPQLEFSWRPYEELCLQEFQRRLSGFKTAADVGQLADPYETMLFLRAKGLLESSFLEALIQWSLAAAHTPNVRSVRRPTSRQLAQLYDWCHEYGLDANPALSDAIGYYVESGGGQWPDKLPMPLKYSRQRRFVKSFDPLEDFVAQDSGAQSGTLASVHSSARSSERLVEDLPGLPSSDGGLATRAADLSEDAGDAESLISLPARSSYKRCGGETVGALITSRKSVRPRHRRDPGLKKILRKNWHRPPIYMMPGYTSRAKYRPGVATRQFPWGDDPVGRRGGVWVHRR
jgi:hypothetical protein